MRNLMNSCLGALVFTLGTSGNAAGVRMNVLYSIPVEDASLEPFATFEFRIKLLASTPGLRQFKYDLPVELDGVGQDILLTESAPGIFSAPNARALCNTTGDLECKITYRNLSFDAAKAERAIDNLYIGQPSMILGRKQVGLVFRQDPEPGGVLKVRR